MREWLRGREWQLGAIGVLAITGLLIAAMLLREGSPPTAPRIATLEDAVALHLVDQAVVDELRASGASDAVIHLNTRPVIARLKQQFGDEAVAELITRARQIWAEQKTFVLDALGSDAELVTDFEHLGAAIVNFRSEQALLAVARSPLIRSVTAIVALDAVPILREPAGASWEPPRYQFSGEGVAIGVIDTGVDAAAYPEYFTADRVAEVKEVAVEDNEADDDGHGTHVSSTIGMVAPDAQLYVADTFQWGDYDGERDNRSVATLDGVDWMVELVERGVPLKAVNLSLGGFRHHTSACYRDDDFQFDDLDAWGVIAVISAGNYAYRDNDGNETPGVFQPGIAWPACVPTALSVGNATTGDCPGNDITKANRVYESSQASSQLGILAPGTCIAAAGGQMTGTSMAAPHVAGAIAVLASSGDYDQAEIRHALLNSGPLIEDPRSGVTVRRLDIPAALARLADPTAPAPVTPMVQLRLGLGAAQPLAAGSSGIVTSLFVDDLSGSITTVSISVEPSGFLLGADAPSAWFTMSPAAAVLSPFGTTYVTVTATIPGDATPGAYAARLHARSLDGNAVGESVLVQFEVEEAGLIGDTGAAPILILLAVGAGVGVYLWRRRTSTRT